MTLEKDETKLSPKIGDTWYRYEDRSEATVAYDINGEPELVGSKVIVKLWELEVTKLTPKGVKLRFQFGSHLSSEEKFVAFHWHKRFAYPTKREAKESFIARKRRQKFIHLAWAKRAQTAIDIAEKETAECPVLHV